MEATRMIKAETAFISSQMSAYGDRCETSEASENSEAALWTRQDMRRVIFQQFSERENQDIFEDGPEIVVIPTCESDKLQGGNKQIWRRNRLHRRVRFGQTAAPVVPVDREIERSNGEEPSQPENPKSTCERFSSGCEMDDRAVNSDIEADPTLLTPRYRIIKHSELKYTAKLLIPASKPLYLGRFKSESAALDACKSALSQITPRMEQDYRPTQE
uniref:AlNc14C191G8438 protein n=1 Tax=Albugo laibachii Nc14 TaxID=890382 RepID=F0WPU6_9STRA|nr:AlNc14C191G8438 [Albugo laibachii Nc14]|eukprot:CCA23347.1 AlNc14C191G8438 [Albugo laibachii Nc14]